MSEEEERLSVKSGAERSQVVTEKINREDTQPTLVKSMRETKKKWKLFLICNIFGWPLQAFFAYLMVTIESKYEDEVIQTFRENEN